MNGVMKQLVKHLLEGEVYKAQQQATIFPQYYGSKVLNDNGDLTEFGLWDSVDYPFPRKLGSLLIQCLNGEESTNQITTEFNSFSEVFRLVDNDAGKLSEIAGVKAIQAMKVEQQCSALDISFETIDTPKTKQKVESFVSEHYSKQGFQSTSLEAGDFFVLMRCASWNLLSRACAYRDTPYLEAMLVDSEDPTKRNEKAVSALLEGVRKSKQKSVVRNFNKIYPRSPLEEKFPGLTADYIASLYEVVGARLLYDIAKLFIEDPYQYRKGWPDVTVFKVKKNIFSSSEGQLFLREVKVKDKLLPSQIIAFKKLKSLIPDIGIVKVNFITKAPSGRQKAPLVPRSAFCRR